MIINIRVDHTLADIETMEKVSKDLKELFSALKEQIDVKEYIEINNAIGMSISFMLRITMNLT